MSAEGDFVDELVMPFVLTDDNGGPYPPEAFQAGWMLGQIWAELHAVKGVIHHVIVHPDWLGQLDLMAMHFDLSIRHDVVEHLEDGMWCNAWLAPRGMLDILDLDDSTSA